MKLPIKGSGNAVARKLQITRGKEKIGMENKAGIHSSPRLFSQRGENRFTLLLSLSFHSTLTGASEEKSLGIFPHTPVFLGRRVRLDTDVTRTIQLNNSQHDFAPEVDFYYFPDIRCPSRV